MRTGLLWTAAQQWGVQAIRMAVLLVLARLVRPEAFGTFALASTILGLAQLLYGQGLTAAITQRHELGTGRLGAAFAALLAGGILAALALAWAAPHAVRVTVPALGPLLQLLSLVLPLNALSGTVMAVWRRDLRFRRMAAVTTASHLLASLVSVVLAVRSFGIWSLAARMLLEAVLMVLFTLHAAPWSALRHASLQAYRDMLRFGLPIAGSNLLALGRNRLDELLIGAKLGMQPLGYYALARRETDAIASLLPAVVGNATVPVMARVQRNRHQVRAILLRGIGLIGALTLPALAAMGAAAPTWVPLVLGSRWQPVTPLLAGFAVIAATRALVGFNLTMQPAAGHPGKRLLLELVTSLLSLGAIVAALPFGIGWVVAASAACLLVLTPMELHWINRWLPLTLRDQAAALRTPAIAAALLLAGTTTVQALLPADRFLLAQTAFVALATLTAIAACYRAVPPAAEPTSDFAG